MQTNAGTVRAKGHCGAILARGCGLRQAKTMTIRGTKSPKQVSSVELATGTVRIESIWEMSASFTVHEKIRKTIGNLLTYHSTKSGEGLNTQVHFLCMGMFSFDNLDDLFEQMRKDQQASDARVLPWQAAIKPGDYVARPGPGFLIYSEILEDPEPRESGLEHYRFTRSYSIACPKGELGDIHVSAIEWKLSEEDFQEVMARGWK